jgi:hypothetical protein
MKNILRFLCAALFLTACQPSPQMIQTAIGQTSEANTPTALYLPATSVPGVISQHWRIDPIASAAGLITEADLDPAFDASIIEKAKGLNITPPFNYETYAVPPSVSFNDIGAYYTPIMEARGFNIAYSDFLKEKNIGLIIYKRSPMSVYVEFWDQPTGYDMKLVMVIYKNF